MDVCKQGWQVTLSRPFSDHCWKLSSFFVFHYKMTAEQWGQLDSTSCEKELFLLPCTCHCVHLQWFLTWHFMYSLLSVTVSTCSSSCLHSFIEYEICYLVLHHFSRCLRICWSVGPSNDPHESPPAGPYPSQPAATTSVLFFFFLIKYCCINMLIQKGINR